MLVSVIIPCFNVEDYIEECLESVYNQIYKNIEVVVVDNNSTDNTLKIVNELKRNLYNDLIILKEEKKGANAARNKGLRIVKGEWVQFLDSDDILNRDKIQHQVDIINKNNNIDVICSSYCYKYLDNTLKINSVDSKNNIVSIFNKKAGITSSNIFKRNSLIEVGNWNEHVFSSQEFDLMFRFYVGGKNFYFDNQPKTIIRERIGQISSSNPKITWKNYIEIRLQSFEKLKYCKTDIYIENYTMLLLSILNPLTYLYSIDKSSTKKILRSLDINYHLVKKEEMISKHTAIFIKKISLPLFFKLLYFNKNIFNV